ncbi:hypothetical protein ABZ370_31315 [Streptomyces sp. NPDC005962]|uniref:hypothetical protein n=1 Tax=Streptomyces sp. NPDC005962 TaxID=3154466 RepID=UPI0033D5E2FA
MIVGWALLGVLVALVNAAVGRGVIRAARVMIRQDLVALGEMQEFAGALAKLTTTVYAFAPPLLKERTSWIGWLWWRTRIGPDGKTERDMGWALTYRRARKASGAPLGWRLLSGSELVVVPRDAQLLASAEGEPNDAPSQGR